MAVLTAYMVEFVKELLPYPKLLISYMWQTIKPTIYPFFYVFSVLLNVHLSWPKYIHPIAQRISKLLTTCSLIVK
jgi:hypothetical protein